VSGFCFGLITPTAQERPVPIGYSTGFAPKPVSKLCRMWKTLVPAWNRTLVFRSSTCSLVLRLSCFCSLTCM